MSDDARFTPGPWKWWTSNSWRRLTAHTSRGDYKQEGDVLCPIVARDGHPDLSVKMGDMSLIAAAPDLDQAVGNLLILVKALTGPDDAIAQATIAEGEMARAKARGEPS